MNKADILVNHEEMDRYQQAVQAYLGLQLDADRFMSARLQQGVYGQRQEGVNMLRVKVPGGKMLPEQLVAIADVLETHVDHPVVHITTRQDFQIHYVPLAQTPAAMQRLAAAGLTTREACGNTVRNITACPLAGVCPREHLDITPVMDGAVAHFLRHPLTQHLPRKFKISFSGCEHDCAQGMMHDVGVIAVKQGDRHGYKVVAGGGLGHKPHEAITVEEFIEEQDLLPSMEALVSLHHRYSDRVKRAKARIKFLVDRFGAEGFVEKYKEEYARTQAAFAGRDYPKGDWVANTPGEACGMGAPRTVFAQKQPGLSVFPISVPIGDITGPQLRGIAQLMLDEGLTDIRTTQDQNLMLMSVPNARIKAIDSALAALGLGLPKAGDDVVACPGTSTCRLGITSSKIIGAKLNGSSADLRIRASGCHNGCAQPETGDIGIYGEGKRLHGKLVPHYQMYFGGDGRAHGGLALKGPSVPAARVETAVSRVQETYLKERTEGEAFFHWTRRRGKESFTELLADLLKITPDEMPSVLHDHGEAADFKVLQLGGGECAGAAQELVSSQFSEAAYERDCRNAFTSQHKYNEALECAEAILRLIGQALLFISGEKKLDDIAEIARVLPTLRPENTALAQRLSALAQDIDALKAEHDETAHTQLMLELDDWTRTSAALCQTTDSQLDLSTSLPRPAVPSAGTRPSSSVALIDLSSYGCPVHYMKARLEVGKIASGEEIDFLLEAGESASQVAESLAKDGHSILSSIEHGEHTRVRVQKKIEAAVSQSA